VAHAGRSPCPSKQLSHVQLASSRDEDFAVHLNRCHPRWIAIADVANRDSYLWHASTLFAVAAGDDISECNGLRE
jgi:hypothetical protein